MPRVTGARRAAAEPAQIDPNEGFARFTPRARNVVIAAQNEARDAGNDTIRTAHLVLALLAEPDGLGARALAAQGVTAERLRAAAVLPERVADPPELVPFDAGAKKALELTFREALRLGHNYVGTEHLLLALLEQEGGPDDGGLLAGLGVTKPASEASVREMLTAATGGTAAG